jgi:hypothetical protein
VAVAAGPQNPPFSDSYQEVNCKFLDSSACRGSAITWLKGLYPHRLRRRHFLRRAKLTGLDDFNVAIAELSQTEAVVSSLVLG